jgi:DnaJ-domain-containing protein 1
VELLQLRQSHRQQTEQADAELPPIEPEIPSNGIGEEESTPPDSLPRLSQATRRALKEMFRRASKLCHPDLVADEFKAEAGVIFIELKSAYEQHDLHRVEEILRMLERGEKLTSRPILSRNKEKLRAEIRYLRRRIEAMHHEIEALKQSNTYRKLVNIDDWDDYFDDLKAELQRKINRLKRKKAPKF